MHLEASVRGFPGQKLPATPPCDTFWAKVPAPSAMCVDAETACRAWIGMDRSVMLEMSIEHSGQSRTQSSSHNQARLWASKASAMQGIKVFVRLPDASAVWNQCQIKWNECRDVSASSAKVQWQLWGSYLESCLKLHIAVRKKTKGGGLTWLRLRKSLFHVKTVG